MAFQLGDIIELPLPSGWFAYLQYSSDGPHAAFVRVLPGFFDEPLPTDGLADMVAGQDRYVFQVGLETLMNNNGRVVGNEPVPQYRQNPSAIRSFGPPSTENPEGWMIVAPSHEIFSAQRYAERHPDIDQTMLPPSSIPMGRKFVRMVDSDWSPKMIGANGAWNLPWRRRSLAELTPEGVAAVINENQGGGQREMGAWGEGVFENDAALDWLVELSELGSWAFVAQSLRGEGERALAAAATVAASMAGYGYVPQRVSAFLARAGLPDQQLKQDALQALDRLESEDLELKELWKEAGSLEAWMREVAKIRKTLHKGNRR